MTKEELGNFIASNRKATGMTQQELADKLHVTNKAVSKWETGLSYPDITLLEPLANALSVNVEELLACKRAEQPEKTPALETLLAISEEEAKRQKKQTRRWIIFMALLIVMVVLLSFIRYQNYCENWRTCTATENGVLEYVIEQQKDAVIKPLYYEEENGVACILYNRSYEGYQDQCIAIFSRGKFGCYRYVGMDIWEGNTLHRSGSGGNEFNVDGTVYIVYGNNRDGLVDNYTFTCGDKEYGRTDLEKDYIVDVYILPYAAKFPYNLRQFNRYNELICQLDKIPR
ncbi:MAG: helix-turn-helix transcriptional regulator [Eubacteriales bacterium]|nr:helix-turn-helix transcriptional regulator [Eubacteriales bacterium]